MRYAGNSVRFIKNEIEMTKGELYQELIHLTPFYSGESDF